MLMPEARSSSERPLDYFGLYLEPRLSGDVAAGAGMKNITAAQHSLNEANPKQRASYRKLQSGGHVGIGIGIGLQVER